MASRSQGPMGFRLPWMYSAPQLHSLPRQFLILKSVSVGRQCKGLGAVGKGGKKQLTSRTTFAKLFTLDQGDACVPLQQCWCYFGIDHAGHDEERRKPICRLFVILPMLHCSHSGTLILPQKEWWHSPIFLKHLRSY